MAVQGSTLVQGAWVSTTFDLDDVLRAHNVVDAPSLMDVESPPIFGLLTQTIIRSPLVHWILPVKFRGPKIHDVAFIGDDFVQIKELRPDGLLWDVIRKDNFGTRIRNACVVGSIEAYKQDPDYRNASPDVKDEEEDVLLSTRNSPTRQPVAGVLPPQYLVIQLESGDSVFLMLHQSRTGKLEFISSRYRLSKVTLYLQPGTQLAVDPSSRYMAMACSEGILAIYAINSRSELKSQYAESTELRFVKAETYLYFPGIIVKMDFLFPSPGDEGHIILLALIVLHGQTRMFIWEWETGSDLKQIKARSQKGHPIEKSRQLPQLLIPLRTNSSFLLICEDSMAVCNDLLAGSPVFTDFGSFTETDPCHHGLGAPLWTSWARPARFKRRKRTHEDIYILREDGIIKVLEINISDGEIGLDHVLGGLGSNCSSAMACLDCWMPDRNGDLIVTGGDSCRGGSYLVHARQTPSLVENIQNWAPAQDFVTTFEDQDRDLDMRLSRSRNLLPKTDRIFSCGGRGTKGAVTEFRHGLEAIVGFEVPYGVPITQVWILYADPGDNDEHGITTILMTVGDHSAVLKLTESDPDALNIDQEFTPFSLGSRTIAAATQGFCLVQVTEHSIIVSFRSSSHTYTTTELLQVSLQSGALGTGNSIWHAEIGELAVVFTTIINDIVWLQVLDSTDNSNSMEVDSVPSLPPKGSVRTLGQFSTNVTALCLATVDATAFAVVAEISGDLIALSFVPLGGSATKVVSIATTYENNSHLESIISIAVSPEGSEHLLLLCGSRNGVLVTMEIKKDTLELASIRHHRIGGTSVILTKDEYTRDLFFADCDSKVYSIRPEMSTSSTTSSRYWLHQIHIHQVWLSDNAKPEYQPPDITSIVRLRPSLSGGIGGSMLFVAGSGLLIARLSLQPKAVPRHLAIGCTPTRLIYSKKFNVLIVAASIDGKSTLLFIDPDTGDNLSEPVDSKTKKPIKFVSGLGNTGERIFRLFEWTLMRNQSAWHYIIVCTSSGRVLVIALDNMDKIRDDLHKRSRIEQNSSRVSTPRPKIRYLMKHKFRGKQPGAAAAAAVGFPEGIIWCSGTRVSCEALIDKKFQTVGKYHLPSPAINMTYKDGMLYVLTKEHSLEIIEMVAKPDGYDLVRTHGDSVTRATLHHTMIEYPTTRPIHLVSDAMSSVVGLWHTQDTKADTLEPIFEAQLPYSVLRFRPARCRPIWDPVWTLPSSSTTAAQPSPNQVLRLEDRPKSMSYAETLGLSISGALSHYSVLDASTWEFLRFLIDLALRSPEVCPFTFATSPIPFDRPTEPKTNMHIDGDILRHCLELRHLEKLLQLGVQSREAELVWERFVMLLQELHMGTLPTGTERGRGGFVKQAYADLAFLLRPVM